MAKRKLPPYADLRKEFLAGNSYAVLAKKYGVHHDSVYQKLKYGAERNGHEWPLRGGVPTREKIRAGLLNATMPADGVAYVLDEAYKKAAAARNEPKEDELVLVPAVALDRTAPRTQLRWKTVNGERQISSKIPVWPKQNAIFHRPGCPTLRNVDCVEMTAQEADAWALGKCGQCFNLSTAQWCIENGWTNSYVRGILSGSIPRVRIANARSMLMQLGEPIPASMKNWAPRSHMWHKRKWENRNKKIA